MDDEHEPPATSLKEDEELNTEKLNNLKSALSDLKIVDVSPQAGRLEPRASRQRGICQSANREIADESRLSPGQASP